MDILEYKGFIGSVHFNNEDDIFYGKLEAVEDLVSFEGRTVKELRKSFEEAVVDYIELCVKLGKNPEKSFKGSFNVRISQDLHRKIYRKSIKEGIPLNQLVQRAIERELINLNSM